jgi:hypothetical protein
MAEVPLGRKRQQSAEAEKDRKEGKRAHSSPEFCGRERAESLQGWSGSEPSRGRPKSEALVVDLGAKHMQRV